MTPATRTQHLEAQQPARVDAVLLGAPIELKPAAAGGLPAKFSGTAYSGGFVPDYGIVIDMASTTYKQKMPLLDSHVRSEIIGVIDQAATQDFRMVVGGQVFSDMAGTPAERIAKLAQRGVPFEMSVGLYAYTREFVPQGKQATVNGQVFNGPVNVLRNGQVREVSIVTLGADPRTESTFFDLPSGDDPMTQQTVEQLSAQVATLTAQLAAAKAEGAAEERARIQAVESALLPGHEALINSLKFDGKTDGGGAALLVMKAERDLRARAAGNLALDAPKPAAPAAAPAIEATTPADPMADTSKSLEDRCKAKWDGDAAVRAEFASLADFTAYTRASQAGKVRVLTGRLAA